MARRAATCRSFGNRLAARHEAWSKEEADGTNQPNTFSAIRWGKMPTRRRLATRCCCTTRRMRWCCGPTPSGQRRSGGGGAAAVRTARPPRRGGRQPNSTHPPRRRHAQVTDQRRDPVRVVGHVEHRRPVVDRPPLEPPQPPGLVEAVPADSATLMGARGNPRAARNTTENASSVRPYERHVSY